MKQLNEYETPITKRNTKAILEGPGEPFLVVAKSVSENLEQRLAACREALEYIANGPWLPASWSYVATETLELTKP